MASLLQIESSPPRAGIRVDRFRWADIELGHFRCAPDSPAWTEDNHIGRGPLLVIPHRAVEIAKADADTVIASPIQAVYYHQDQIYRRRLIDPRGDDCVYIYLPDAIWTRLSGERLSESWGHRLSRGPIVPALLLRFEHLLAQLRGHAIHERLEFEERLLVLVDALINDAAQASELRREQPLAHAQLGRAAEALLAAHFCEDLGIDQIATTLATSPAHLSRVFRRHTGTSLHQHRINLRLATAVELAADPQRSLTDVALELGFASPSHFSDLFRRHLGVPPSSLRGSSSRQRRALCARAGI